MPKRTDLKSIAIIGAGPIVIGQACEFDYSGTQACKALKEDGYRVILINSNPATIMTDPEVADRTYIEPILPEFVERVLRKERPDALLPTMGGQTGLNTAFQVADAGVLDALGIELIGADRDVIHRAEDRDAFRQACREAGCDVPRSGLAHTLEEAREVVKAVGLPCIVRPAFTLGGLGGGMAYNHEEFERIAANGLRVSLVSEILIEESVERWKELEVELMADGAGNRIVVCLIENVDPMGVHTGDSIAVAPTQTLTDRENQRLRDEAMRIMASVGLKTCGCNVQFAQNPRDGRLVAIELNPRVSRSSALASKATGYPIARVAAKVAVGYLLPEIENALLGQGSACFEPGVDYVVAKFPRFAFEKFPGSNEDVTIQMKSVGEVMAIGSTFKEATQKALRSLENGRLGWGADGKDLDPAAIPEDVLMQKLSRPNRDRFLYLRYALQRGMGLEEIFAVTGIDPWWLDQLREILEMEDEIRDAGLPGMNDAQRWHRAKSSGFSDEQLAHLLGAPAAAIRAARLDAGVRTVYKSVDGCGGAHDAARGYYWGTYGDECESRAGTTGRDAVLILGGGPNRIGQGLEFDYCCCHAAYAVRDAGLDAVLVNCNPETVSTDFDTSDRLYFEPLTVEDVLAIVDREKPRGVIVQFGGQTPLNISRALLEAGVPILGTSVDSIDRASDRGQFAELLRKLGLNQPPNGTATTLDGALEQAARVGYPVLCRPSFVLGGAKMEIVADDAALRKYWTELLVYCTKADVQINERRPILIDKFLDDAIEVDVDAISDGRHVYIAGVMEHIEEAGVHSGDSACSLPPHSLKPPVIERLEKATRRLALELGVLGLMNVQYAIQGDTAFVLEVNPRASRTVPFVSKVTGVSVARLATRVMLGESLEAVGLPDGSAPTPPYFGVKEAVFPFSRFPGADAVLGPEMKSTGEVMGLDPAFPLAFAKSQLGAGQKMPLAGTVFLSVCREQHGRVPDIAQALNGLGFKLVATAGTARAIRQRQIPVEVISKISAGRPNINDLVTDNRVHLIINVPSGKSPSHDEVSIRTTAVTRGIPLITTLAGARAYLEAVTQMKLDGDIHVHALQDAIVRS